MKARARVPLGVGAAGLLALAGLWWSGQPVLPAYLAAWLFVIACPLGALPLVMAHDLFSRQETHMPAALRAMLPLVVPAALMAVPVVMGRAALYPTMATAGPFAAVWMAPGAILWRTGVAGLVWLLLAFVFRRPPRRAGLRAGLAGLGLVLHLVLGTLVAGDWVAALDPALRSASFPLIVLAGQSGVALSIAVLSTAATDAFAAAALLGLFGAWLFLHFTQYLVVWSANLPTEVPWYIARDGGLGGAAEAGAAVVFLVALIVLLRGPGPRAVAGIAAAILVVHGVEMFWLVGPAGRGAFSLDITDLAATMGLVGLAAAVLAILGPRPTEARP